MPLRLEITSYHQRRLKEASVKEFGVDGGSIGRSLESDWVLQDGKRYVSSRHASIDFRSGSYYIVDVSSNGVYVNNEIRPVGKAKPQRLFDGDRIRIGEYEMVAHIVESTGADDQLSNELHVDPVDRAQQVDNPDLTGHELVSEHEMTAVGIEDLLLENAEASVLKRTAMKAAAGMTLELETSEPKRLPESSVAADGSGQRKFEAAENLPSNSLNFPADVDEALSALISEPSAEHQSAIDSIREAFQEMKIHQDAMIEAVRIALSDFIERLDPDELEQKFDQDMKRDSFDDAANKLRYWDLYRDIFQMLSQHAPGQFPQTFAEEFARTYEEEIVRLKGKRRAEDSGQAAADTIPQAETG